ncbi:2-keto-4-pentenoate hydratase/2-oxohepta-3-ene-1,7-dioic acid hydratase in catechol pathway [Mesorhizobium loti]|uniref:2-keto-4-pentenoate hydratase/2-oxohepta-3-ene-1,7-dioic acid hydratase in catechol pathway n=2 Tax=Phyllobacteriaceae TaxID=69277 RepID=A0A8E3B732_RHILI|nr:2-keto-4-pentenoate hydratase/2-oxohepta-3-ene-1,7-dioic acid hydratase in catechol pathway [Mesorhizobium loti]
MFGASEPTGALLPLESVQVAMPCVPSKMIALWNNSRTVAATQGLEIPKDPMFFIKPANSYAGQNSVVEHSAVVGRILFEGELGIIIGRRCLNASIEVAEAAIFGYTCVNDLTAHAFLQAESGFTHWTRAKGLDGFAPFGPVIATDIDPAGLTIRTRVNGRERQSYSTSDLIFQPARLISLISRGLTLLPGDLIACGTSAGVGPLPKEGAVEVEIDGIGILTTQCRPPQ